MAKMQCYNDRNKCYVLMEAGMVLDNKKDEFEGVPFCDEVKKKDPEPEPVEVGPDEQSERMDSQESAKNPWAWY